MKTRRFFAAVLIGILFCSISFGYSGGSGTATDPYQIATKSDLLALAATTADYSKYYILTADIDLEGQIFTTAAIAADADDSSGFQGIDFSGSFDGNGHIIRHLTINPNNIKKDFLGLFGFVRSGAVIKNLGVKNVIITNVGSSSFVAGGLVGGNYGTITNCYTTGSVTTTELAGGLSGYNFGPNGIISYCYANTSVNASSRWINRV